MKNPLISALAGAWLLSALSPVRAQTDAAPRSLYERLGGVQKLAVVADAYVERLLKNPAITANAGIRGVLATGAVTVPGMKYRFAELFSSLSGGPFLYTGTPVAQLEKGLGLTAEQIAALDSDLNAALEASKVPDPERKELLGLLAKARKDVASVVPAETLAEIRKVYDAVSERLAKKDLAGVVERIEPEAHAVLANGQVLDRAGFRAAIQASLDALEGFAVRFEVTPVAFDGTTVQLMVTQIFQATLTLPDGRRGRLEGIETWHDQLRRRDGAWRLLSTVNLRSVQTIDGLPVPRS